MSEICPDAAVGAQGRRAVQRRWTVRLLGAVIAATGVLVLAGCQTGAPAAPPGPSVEVSTARLVDAGEFAAVIVEPARMTVNVHVPFEGDIPGTDLSIPFDQIAAQADRLPADRDSALAIYCRSGPMSAKAVEALVELGYTDVVELRGGMKAWQAAGRSLIGV